MRTRSIAFSPAGRAGFIAVTLTALLAGCGSAEESVRPAAPVPAQPPAAAPGNPAASTPSPVQASPSAKASNGTDLAACKDADCEVEVREGDRLKIDPRFGLDTITVRSIGRGEVTVALEGTSGQLKAEGRNVSVSTSCMNGRCHDQGMMSLTTTWPGRINKIRLRLVAITDSRAILSLKPE
jgi:hypothetical protein